MQVHELVARFSAAAGATDSMSAAREVIEELKRDLDQVAQALSYLPGTGGNAMQAFYRAPDLSLLKVSFPAGRRTPPHNHGTWATILVFSGHEKNTLYREENEQLRRVSEVELERGSILPMREDTVHVAECLGDEPALGLHVYGGNVLGGTTRHMWDPETLDRYPMDWDLYEQFAKKASSLDAAP